MMKFELEWRIGKYPISQEIGRGATSRVYLARDPFADRDVAIKVFFFEENLSEQTAKLLRKGFLAEAALAGRLNHPHIVAIYDAVSEPEYSYIVMEYVKGTTLETYAEIDCLLPLSKVVEVIFKCIRALDYAFQMGVIHRDIKPGQHPVQPRGRYQGERFRRLVPGGARAGHDPAHRHRIPGVHVAGADPARGSHAPDRHLLARRGDVQAADRAAAVQRLQPALAHLRDPERRPAGAVAAAAGAPALLDEICLKAMQKNAADRYDTWIDFGKDLSKAFSALRLAGETISDSAKFNELRTLAFFEDFDDVTLWEALRISAWRTIPRGP